MKPLATLLLAAALLGGADLLAQGPQPGGQRIAPGGSPAAAGGEIRGAVVDAESSRALSSATVAVWSAADSSLVTGAVARADGRFRVEGLRPGRYYVTITHLGYTTHRTGTLAIAPGGAPEDLGSVAMKAGAVALEGLTVTAERSQAVLAPDRNVYRVADMPSSAGGTATDALRNVPAIEVDVDGKVSLRGSQNVAVQINGRPTPMRGEQLAQYLQQLPAAMLDRVEVVASPSAKDDPEGMAGIVNLVMKENVQLGTSGGVMLATGTTDRINASGNLAFQRGPVTVSGMYGFFTDERETRGFNNRENLFLEPMTYLEQDIEGAMSPTSHNVNVMADWKLSEQNLLSSSTMVSKRAFDVATDNLYRELDAARELTSFSGRLSEAENDDLTVDQTLAFKRTLQPQRNELSAELRYSYSDNDRFNRFTQRALTAEGTPTDAIPARETNALDALTHNYTAQLDYTRALGEAAKLETGYKGTLRQLDNDFEVAVQSIDHGEYLPDPARSNAFRFDEQVHAAYAVLSRKAGPFDLQAGVRAEQAATEFALEDDQTYDNDYTSIFPSALAAYNLDESRQLKASYSKRVQRPDTRLLNPFAFYEDPLNLFRGNPHLKPEYTHAFELGYQQNAKWGSLQVTPFYRHTVDAVRRIKTVDDEGVSTTTFQNLATSDSWGTDLTASLRRGPLSGFAGVSAFRTVSDASNVDADLSNEAFAWSTRVNASWRASPRLDAQGFLMYRAPMDVEGGHISGMTMMHFALRQKLMGEKATVTLRAVDPFDLMGFSFRTADDRHVQVSERKFGARGLYLSFSYNFGRPPRMRQQPGAGPDQQEQPGTDVGIQ